MAGEVPDRVIAPLLEESLDDLYEHAPCGYLSALPDGLVVRVNQTFLEWTGYERDDLVGVRRFQDLLTPGGRIYHETHYAPLLRMQGAVREIALQLVRADGSRLPVLINSTLRQSDSGTVVRTTVFDASDRRSYERELLEARRRETEARERTEALQRLTEALVGASDEAVVATAALQAVMDALGAEGGTVHVDRPDGEGATLATVGEPADGGEELELPGSAGPVGRLRVRLPHDRELTDPDRAFLLAAARQCGQALERAALFAETRRTARRAAFLAAMAETLERTPELDERARRLVQLVVPALAAGARIDLLDDHGRTEVVAEGGAGGRVVELPLLARGRRLGTLALHDPARAEPGATGFLADVAGRAALALENAQLYEHEREVARALQESMLTRRLPEDPRFLVATHYQPAMETMEVGGDWYDAFPLGPDRLAIVVGDVVGRGIEAASAMGQLRSAVRALAGAAAGPAAVLERLDDFVEQIEIARSATLVYADVDLTAATMRYACAGHPPPVVVPPDAEPLLLWDGRSPPLGASFAGLGTRTEATAPLAAGTRVLLYTDGLVERRGQSIDEGIDRLVAVIQAHRAAPLASLADCIPSELLDEGDVRDDVCLLAMAFGTTERFERSLEPDVSQLAPLRLDLRRWLDAHAVGDPDRNAVVLACSEAVGNAVEHGCDPPEGCAVEVAVAIEDGHVVVVVEDRGAWRRPPAEGNRGRGLTLMRRCMDEVDISTEDGTTVRMRRALGRERAA